MSFDVILPFLRPIEGLIKDPEVSEIMVNAPTRVFIERKRASGRSGRVFPSRKNLCRWRCATSHGRLAMKSAKRSRYLIPGFPMDPAWRQSSHHVPLAERL